LLPSGRPGSDVGDDATVAAVESEALARIRRWGTSTDGALRLNVFKTAWALWGRFNRPWRSAPALIL